MKNEKTYHLALCKDYNNPKRVVLEARRCIDFLSCEAWIYIGERVVTKKHLRDNKIGLLQWINKQFNTTFTVIAID